MFKLYHAPYGSLGFHVGVFRAHPHVYTLIELIYRLSLQRTTDRQIDSSP